MEASQEPMEGSPTRVARYGPAALVVAFVAVATLYGVVTPVWEAPDEVGHMAFVAHLVRERALPIQVAHSPGEEHQPPLYYLLAALPVALLADLDDPTGRFRFNRRVAWAGEGGSDVNVALHGADETFPYRGSALAVHVARAVSIACAALTVMLTIAIGRLVFPRDDWLPLLAAVLVAANPQFVFIAASVNNDNLVAALAAALLLVMTSAVTAEVSAAHWWSAAVITAAACLTKLSIAPVIAVVFIALATRTLRDGKPGLLVQGLLATTLLVAVSFGWWLARNVALYGDPLGWNVYRQTFAVALRHDAFPVGEYLTFLTTQFRSFWGCFGWMTVSPPRWFYVAAGGLTGVALVGVATWANGRSFLAAPSHARTAVAMLGGAILAEEMYLTVAIRTTFGPSWYQGRYLFPVLPAAGVVMATGLLALVPRRRQGLLAVGVTVAAFATVVWIALVVIAPAYRSVG